MKQYISAFIIGITLILFCTFCIYIKSTNQVLNVISPISFQIDLNSNGIADDNETVCVPNIETFILGEKAPEFAQNMDIKTLLSMDYLAEEFSKNKLLLKDVKVKFTKNRTPDCRFAEIYTDNQNYSDVLIESGFAKRNDEFNETNYKTNLEKAQKQNLVILNHKSYKYHKLDCEYGLQSHDYTIVQQKQLPKDALPCKFCHTKEHNLKPVTKTETVFSNGNIKIILPDFTKHLKPDTRCETQACMALIKEINNANKSIDLALYGFDNSPKVLEALKSAKRRNVKIRFVYDKQYSSDKEYYKGTPELVKLADESMSDYKKGQPTNTNKLMHNKFMIVDSKTVYTGSMNFSHTGLSDYNANTVIIINSSEVADLYKHEFEQMLSGKFHNEKIPLKMQNTFDVSGSKISVYFSPYDKTSKYIIPLINSAKEYIYLPTFLITHSNISDALINAKRRGVDIKIIIDAGNTSTLHSKLDILRKAGVQVKTEIFAGKMHSKTMIIDNKYIIAGSMNFSNSGENKNDENCLIIENHKLAKDYRNFFMYLWNKIPDFWLTHNAFAEGKDSAGSCSDGIDNDFDGLTDGADSNCISNLR